MYSMDIFISLILGLVVMNGKYFRSTSLNFGCLYLEVTFLSSCLSSLVVSVVQFSLLAKS